MSDEPPKRGRRAPPALEAGMPARNAGMKLPAEILTQEEIALLLDAFSTVSATGKRGRAMIGLMYRAEVKVGQLAKLAIRHYDRESATLNVPGSQGGADKNVRLDAQAQRLLEEWLDARASLRVRPTAPMFCSIEKPAGKRMRPEVIRATLRLRAEKVGIQKRVSPEGLRKSRQHHRENEAGRFETSIAEYVNAEEFRARYPVPHLKWSDAYQLLETAPDRHATTIGHLCREAINQFSDELVRRAGLGPFESNKTKNKINAVFVSDGDASRSVRRSLVALVDYWETVSDLVQRQEHGSDLMADDSRRLVFQTMLVMREIDLALTRGA